MPRRWLGLGLAIGLLLGAARPSQATPVVTPPPKMDGAPSVLQLDEKPEPLAPLRGRSEAERDRIEALTLYSTARRLEQREKYADALRTYQRAFRHDPQSAGIARAVVALAVRQKRQAEAVRYALKLADLSDVDPGLLQRLAIYLVETGDFARAATFYERALLSRKDAPVTSADVIVRMELGRLYHLLEKYPQSADHFARVLDALDHPERVPLDSAAKKALLAEPAATYGLLGESFLQAGRIDQAQAAFEKSHQSAANPGLRGYNLARVELKRKQPAKALGLLEAYFNQRLAIEGLGPYRLLADILKELKQDKELIPRLEKLRAADAGNVPLGYFLAGQYREARLWDKAEPLFVKLIEKSPTLTGYRGLVDIYRQTNRPEKLLGVLAQAVAKTSSLEPLGAEGKAVWKDAGLVQRILEVARAGAKEGDKFSFEARLAAALVAMEAKQYPAASEFFDRAIQARPKQAAELLLTWGLALAMDEQHAEAIKIFRRGAERKAKPEETAVFLFYLAGSLEMAGQTDAALDAARKAAVQKKDTPRFANRVAWILYHAKRYAEADRAYREVLAKYASDYGSAEVRQVVREARLALSNLAVIAGKMPEAEQWLEEVLDEFPDDLSASNDLGYLWADANKNLGRAERMIRKAVQGEPDNAAYRDSLGWVLFRLGRFPEAVTELEKAAAAEPDAVVLDHLGDAYARLKQLDKARTHWKRAAEAFQKQGKKDDAAKTLRKAHP